MSRRSPMAWMILVRSCPDSPAKGVPSASSSEPGESPQMKMSALRLPVPKIILVLALADLFESAELKAFSACSLRKFHWDCLSALGRSILARARGGLGVDVMVFLVGLAVTISISEGSGEKGLSFLAGGGGVVGFAGASEVG